MRSIYVVLVVVAVTVLLATCDAASTDKLSKPKTPSLVQSADFGLTEYNINRFLRTHYANNEAVERAIDLKKTFERQEMVQHEEQRCQECSRRFRQT